MMRTTTITIDYAHPRGYEIGYQGENNIVNLALPVPEHIEGADGYRVYFESSAGEYLQTELLTPVDGYVNVTLTSDIIPAPGQIAAQLVAFADGDIIGKAPVIYGTALYAIPSGTERVSKSIEAEIALNSAARHTHANKDVLDRLSDKDGKLQFDGKEISGGGGAVDSVNGKTGAVVISAEDIQVDTETTVAEMLQQHEDDILSVGEFIDEINDAVENITPGGIGAQPAVIQHSYSTAQVSVTLADNAEYRMTGLQTLTVQFPENEKFECWLSLTFAASGTVTVTLPTGTKYIGLLPDFQNKEVWELSIKDGVAVAQKVGDGT